MVKVKMILFSVKIVFLLYLYKVVFCESVCVQSTLCTVKPVLIGHPGTNKFCSFTTGVRLAKNGGQQEVCLYLGVFMTHEQDD